MQSLKLRVAIPTLFAFLLLVLALVAAPLAPAALAQESVDSPALPRTITVVGEGKTSIKPDIARVNIGVEVMKESVQEASAENKATVEAVLEALKAAGVEERDIQTSGYSVYVERYGMEGPLAENELRYRVSNNVNVKIRDLEDVSSLLDAAIEAAPTTSTASSLPWTMPVRRDLWRGRMQWKTHSPRLRNWPSWQASRWARL